MPAREWRLRFEDILEAIVRIERYVEGLTFEQFQADQKTVDAVIRNVEIIGEAVRHLATRRETCRPAYPGSDRPPCPQKPALSGKERGPECQSVLSLWHPCSC